MQNRELMFAECCRYFVHCCVLLSNDWRVLLCLVQAWGKDGVWVRFNFILIDCSSKEIGKMKAGLGLCFIFNLSHCIPQDQEFFMYYFYLCNILLHNPQVYTRSCHLLSGSQILIQSVTA